MTQDVSTTQSVVVGSPKAVDGTVCRANLLGMDADELGAQMIAWGQPAYRGRQVFRWLYQRRADTFEAMTDLPKSLRGELALKAELAAPAVVTRAASRLDATVKYLFALADGEQVETVLMYEGERATLCVSSQVGCNQACTFCATAQMGLARNLTAGEMVGQFLEVEREIGVGRISNVVFMGMGEPLANYSALLRALRVLTASDGPALPARRITVSTSGLVPAIERYARDGVKTGLALSLNATTDDVRDRLIPSNRRYRIRGVLDACRHWADTTGGRLTVEYVLLRGVNDSTEDARRLGDLLEHVPCKVNLIPFNPIPSASFARPEPARVAAFQKILYDARRVATVRKTKGSDVAAACGQLQGNYAGTTRSETAAGSVAR